MRSWWQPPWHSVRRWRSAVQRPLRANVASSSLISGGGDEAPQPDRRRLRLQARPVRRMLPVPDAGAGGVRKATGSGSGVRRARPSAEEDPVTATQVGTERIGDKLLGRVAFVTGGTRGIGAA